MKYQILGFIIYITALLIIFIPVIDKVGLIEFLKVLLYAIGVTFLIVFGLYLIIVKK